MTFEEWWNTYLFLGDDLDKDVARAAWDEQQQRIDRLEAAWRDDDSLTLAYLRGFSDGKKAAQEQDEYGGCHDLLAKLDAKEYGDA